MIDVESAIKNEGTARSFAQAFLRQYMAPAFGAQSKREIDLIVFSSLIEAKIIDPKAPIYEIARSFNLPTSRVRSLLFNWELRSTDSGADLREALIESLQHTRFVKDGTFLTFGIESPLLREDIIARLKRGGIFSDATFSKEIVRLPVEAFVEFLDQIVDAKTKRDLKKVLVKDKQLPDCSFKALASGVLGKLGERLAGKAGEELAGSIVAPASEQLSGFLSSLLRGNATSAVQSAHGLFEI